MSNDLSPECPVDLEHISTPVLLVSERGLVRELNAAADRLLRERIPPEQLSSGSLSELVGALRDVADGESVSWQPREDRAPLQIVGYGYGGDCWLVFVIEGGSDPESEARRLQRHRLEVLGRLLATIAHDLRSPLSSILYNVTMIADVTGDSGPMSDTIDDMLIATERLQETVHLILDFVRSGDIREPVYLPDVVRRVHTLMRPHFRDDSNSRLELNIRDDAMWVLGNRLSVELILTNLVTNAVEASEGDVIVRLDVTRYEDTVEFKLTDDGPGVSTGLRARIFETFFTTKRSGAGLGLSSARFAAAQMNGSLRAVPFSRGACFILTLPAAVEGDPT